MKKTYLIVIILAVVILIAGAAAFFYTGFSVDRAENTHMDVFQEYGTLKTNAANTVLTLHEDGVVIGAYSLDELGVLQPMLAAIEHSFTETDRMPPLSFAALEPKEKMEWFQTEQPQNRSFSPDLSNLDLTLIFADLEAQPRQAPQNAYVDFINDAFLVHEEVAGTTLQPANIQAALTQVIKDMTVTAGSTGDARFELTDCDCYELPELTVENTFFDFPAMLHDSLQDVEVTVDFHGKTEVLKAEQLETILYTDEKGGIQIHEDVLRPIITGWWEVYQEKMVPYLFNSYVDGIIPIDFIKVDYEINQDALFDTLSEELVTLKSTEVEPEWYCWRHGEAFAIEGEYIEVDITNQTMTYFKDDEVMVTTPIVSGATWGYPTPEGLMDVANKDTDCWLSGPDYNVHVDYWLGIVGYDIGIHDADWRTKFGGQNYIRNGSHGCINTPKPATKIIFDNADIGTTVLVHGK